MMIIKYKYRFLYGSHTGIISLLFFTLLTFSHPSYGSGLVAPSPGFKYNAQEIIKRMNIAMAHPARYTGLFRSAPGFGRLATITNCNRQKNGKLIGNFTDTCDLTGVPVGTTANLQLTTYKEKLINITLEVENNITADAGLTALASSLAEGALINAVDPLSQLHGLASKTHEALIMEGLAPDKHMGFNKTVRADGLTFKQYFLLGDLVLSVNPTGYK